MYKFIGAGTTEPINESCSYDKLSLHWPAPKAALAANTKNEFYISTFAIICIIYDVLGNVVKLRPLKRCAYVWDTRQLSQGDGDGK